MSKPPKDDLAEAKRIAAKMLAMPPAPRGDAQAEKAKARVGKRKVHQFPSAEPKPATVKRK